VHEKSRALWSQEKNRTQKQEGRGGFPWKDVLWKTGQKISAAEGNSVREKSKFSHEGFAVLKAPREKNNGGKEGFD